MNILNSQTKMPELDSNIEIQDDVLPDITFDQSEILQNTPVIAKRIEYKPKYKTFGEAFAAARNAGLKEFEWKGKSYNTNIANTPVIPEVPIDIEDSNIEVPGDFTYLQPKLLGNFLEPVFFDRNPQIGWPMPITEENAVTQYTVREI